MKKISILLALIMVLSAFSAMTVSAGPFGIIPVDDIHMPLATPTIDGVINADEGWSKDAPFDFDHTAPYWAHNAMTSNGTMNFAYSEDGIYFAVDINEIDHIATLDQNGDPADYDGNGFVYSTGNDYINPKVVETKTIDPETGEEKITTTTHYDYGFDGDIITLMIDPGSSLLNVCGFSGGSDYTAWYNVGLFADGTAKMYRAKINEGDITDQVTVAAKIKEPAAGTITDTYGNVSEGNVTGWTVEAFIPWEIIIADVADLSFGELELKKDDIVKDGYTSKAAIMYMDRFNDPDSGLIDTWGRWITVCERTPDGVSGPATSGINVKCLGLTLVNGAEIENPFKDIPETSWYTDACLWCNDKGYMTGMTADTFGPNVQLSRAQFVQILAKVNGVDLSKVAYQNKFSDVPAGKWFTNAVMWAVDFGVTGGIGGGKFGPNDLVTRAQLASFLRTYAEKSGKDVSGRTNISGYADYAQVPGWAKEAMSWAVNAGLISSAVSGQKVLAPTGIATRAQVAVIVKNLCENIVK